MRTTLNPEELGALCICALRYCQGRQTYMPSHIQGICKSHLSEFDDRDITVMLKDCERQEEMQLFGSETIDKPGWLAWRKALEEEQIRRHGKA